jgi:hypothetical protein
MWQPEAGTRRVASCQMVSIGNGLAYKNATEEDPADWPGIVTLPGSPPKVAIFDLIR